MGLVNYRLGMMDISRSSEVIKNNSTAHVSCCGRGPVIKVLLQPSPRELPEGVKEPGTPEEHQNLSFSSLCCPSEKNEQHLLWPRALKEASLGLAELPQVK